MPTKTERSSPRITAGGILQEFWDIFPKTETEYCKSHWNFHLCVFVDSWGTGPFHARYEFCRDFGVRWIPNVYSHQPLPDGDLMFVFPCRWLAPRYAMMFNHELNRHPSIVSKPRRRVMIVTMQPYLVGDCMKEQVLIVKDPEFQLKENNTHSERQKMENFGMEAVLDLLGAKR